LDNNYKHNAKADSIRKDTIGFFFFIWYDINMTNNEMHNQISLIHRELDSLLAAGDRDSIMKSIALTGKVSQLLCRKDDGIRYVVFFQNIWMEEQTRSEYSIFTNIHSVEDVLRKSRLVRHAFFRLENDFPDDLCIEALQTISRLNISNTAFQKILEAEIEDNEKIISRINEISQGYTGV
jgi:hypothetical protein